MCPEKQGKPQRLGVGCYLESQGRAGLIYLGSWQGLVCYNCAGDKDTSM